MRDGHFTVYRVQHYNERHDRWTDSALDEILFARMSFEDKRGVKGTRYRDLLQPEHDCWQQTGLHAFQSADDARAALVAARRESDYRFRVVVVYYSKETRELPGTDAKWLLPAVRDILVATDDIVVPEQPQIDAGEHVVYEGEYDGQHLVRTIGRETYQVDGPTLGYEVQVALTEDHIRDLLRGET